MTEHAKEVKLSEILMQAHISGDFGLSLEGYSERAAELETELEITESHYAQCAEVLRKIPECQLHGFYLPHYADWIESSKKLEADNEKLSAEIAELKAAIFKSLQDGQKPLPPEFAQILHDHSWDMYIKDDKPE